MIAGIGCRRDCPAEDIVAIVMRAQAQIGGAVSTLAAPHFKRRESGLQQAARALALDMIWIDAVTLDAAQPRCVTRSAVAARATGTASVAEGCALAAAGPGGRLVLPRIAGARATCALAARA